MEALSLSEAARSVWAKSPDDEKRWLPLWQHMDDSADVAERLFDRWFAPGVVQLISREFGGDTASARTAVAFLAGIHDLGKATPAFAIQHAYLAQQMRTFELYMPDTKQQLDDRAAAPHADAGHHLLIRWLEAKGWPKSKARAWGVVLGGHHGVPPDAESERAAIPVEVPHLYGSDAWERVQQELADRIAVRTGADKRLEEWGEVKLSQQFQVLVTAIVIIADWIASNDGLFPYLHGGLPEIASSTDRADKALASLNLPTPWHVQVPSNDVKELFTARFALPDGAEPRPAQQAMFDIARSVSEPGLMILEAPMGEGKTEAALAAAELLAEQSGAGGLLVALPTQATTDAMFSRIVGWLDRMGADDQDVGGSIMLSHGKARFDKLFQGLLAAGRDPEMALDDPHHAGDGGSRRRRTKHAVVAHSWLTGRKKAQLANFTIGTIDQLLFAGLKSRHLMLRHLALAGKIVVLDEIHAYDAYMNSYLTKVLTWLGAYRVPVIALSATLPGSRRRELVDAYQTGRERAQSDQDGTDTAALGDDIGYPIVTWTDGQYVRTAVTEVSGRRTTVHLDTLADDDLVAKLHEVLADGGTALVVRNTVPRVLEAAVVLEEEFFGEVTVTHSRFVVADRKRKDESLLRMFGPPDANPRRPVRHIVVASQVVEQSLDVDFDVLITDLAPVDLVLQRMGRLHRHDRDRPERLSRARTYVTGLDLSQSPPELEEKAAKYVYGRHALLRSAAALLPRIGGTVELPDDIPDLVQKAYGPAAIGPDEWHEAMADAEQHWQQQTVDRQEKAEVFQIKEPNRPGRAIVGWLSASVGDTADEAQGQGQVRDGAPSLEAMVIQSDADGRWHTPAWLEEGMAKLPVSQDIVPADDVAQVMLQCAVRLPLQFSNAASEEALWHATPVAWEASKQIFRLPVLVVDGGGWGEINDRRVRYTAEKGLEVFSDDE